MSQKLSNRTRASVHEATPSVLSTATASSFLSSGARPEGVAEQQNEFAGLVLSTEPHKVTSCEGLARTASAVPSPYIWVMGKVARSAGEQTSTGHRAALATHQPGMVWPVQCLPPVRPRPHGVAKQQDVKLCFHGSENPLSRCCKRLRIGGRPCHRSS